MEEEYLFYAETPYGHIVKVLVEVLHSCLTNTVVFDLEKSGITSVCVDKRGTTLIDVNLRMENFARYECHTPRTISANLKHLQKALKNVKKKDEIILYIKSDQPNILYIVISPTNVAKKQEKSETFTISILDAVSDHLKCEWEYHFPKVIPSTDYQKMCKKMKDVPGKVVTVTIQEQYYVSFFCDGSGVMSARSSFGEKREGIEEYEGEFYTTMLAQLQKVTGLSPTMQIAAPKDPSYPIKITIKAGMLGELTVTLKTKTLIEFEAAKNNTVEVCK